MSVVRGAVIGRWQRRLWHGDVFVDFENNLNTAVARLREALCDCCDHPRFIETLPRRGYRFKARVTEATALPQSIPPTRARVVVLPFVNLSGDPAQDYVTDAMTDEIITAIRAADELCLGSPRAWRGRGCLRMDGASR